MILYTLFLIIIFSSCVVCIRNEGAQQFLGFQKSEDQGYHNHEMYSQQVSNRFVFPTDNQDSDNIQKSIESNNYTQPSYSNSETFIPLNSYVNKENEFKYSNYAAINNVNYYAPNYINQQNFNYQNKKPIFYRKLKPPLMQGKHHFQDITAKYSRYAQITPIKRPNLRVPDQQNNYSPIRTPLQSFFDSFTKQSSRFTQRINRALEGISKNDELECVPRILCQMIGDPTRRMKLPGFLSSQTLISILTAIPTSSPALIFGKAALLGISGGEDACWDMYNKCPEDEEEVLYYLNNHKGGFFRFFNEEPQSNHPSENQLYQQQEGQNYQQYGGQQNQQQVMQNSQQQETQGYQQYDNIQQSSYQKPQKRPTSSGGMQTLQSFANMFGQNSGLSLSNLASKFDIAGGLASLATGLGNYISPKKLKKRSAELEIEEVTTKNQNIEPRILNTFDSIEFNDNFNQPYHNGRDMNKIVFKELPEHELKLNHYMGINLDYKPVRGGKRIRFNTKPILTNIENSQNLFTFPDRTGTGNLIFDTDKFQITKDNKRHQKILTGDNNIFSSSGYYTQPTKKIIFNYQNKNPVNIRDRYQVNYFTTSRPLSQNSDQNIYVTNSRGVVEYYLNPRGEKIYV